MRMAALVSRRWHAFPFVALPLFLLLILSGLVGKFSEATASEAEEGVQVSDQVVQASGQLARMPPEQASAEEQVRLTESAADSRRDSSLSKLDAEEQDDLDLLRSFMAAADATDTEKQTDERFLGLSRRIRRHLLVDFLGLTALLAGCYLIVTGLESKAPKKAAGTNTNNSNPKSEG